MWSLDTLAGVVVAGSAAATAYFAWRGLSAWRAQMLGQHAFDAARALMRAAFNLHGAAQTARFPWMPSGEMRTAQQREGASKQDVEHATWEDAYMAGVRARWHGVEAARAEFNLAVMDAKILLGRQVEEWAKPMRSCIGDLFMAIMSEARARSGRGRAVTEEESQTAWYTSDDRAVDGFTGRLDDAVQVIEAASLPFLHRARK
jgi:hypothetical protein